jgi:tetratricopeptide (TPR) repeat protein
MIEYLEKLIEDREYLQAVSYAERLLLDTEHTSQEIVAIHCAMLTARVWLGENHGALVTGELVLQLAKELEAWDYYGTACLSMGVVHGRLCQYDAALQSWYDYIEHRRFYDDAIKHEAVVWFNIGKVCIVTGDRQQALTSLAHAMEACNRIVGHGRYAHGIRQALINVYIEAGETSPVPGLLVKCDHYLRHHPDALEVHESWLWELKLRAEFAAATDRPQRAIAVALHGIAQSEGMPRHQFSFHMLLANLQKKRNHTKESLGHSLAARVYAVQSQRYDYEAEATNLMYEIMNHNPDAFRDMVLYYQQAELDSILHVEVGSV